MPKLATAMERTVISDCIGYKKDGDKLLFTRQMFQGKLAADVSFTCDAPWFVTFQNGAFRGDKVEAGAAAAPVETVERRNRRRRGPQQAAGSLQGSQAGRRSDAGGNHRVRRPRHQRTEEYRTGEAAGRRSRRRTRGVAPHLRLGLAAHGPPDRIVGTDGRAQTLSCAWASAAPFSTSSA